MLIVLICAGALLLASQVWLVVLGYRRSGLLWAVLMVFFSLIAGLVFCITKKEGWVPWGLNLASWFCVIAIKRNWF